MNKFEKGCVGCCVVSKFYGVAYILCQAFSPNPSRCFALKCVVAANAKVITKGPGADRAQRGSRAYY